MTDAHKNHRIEMSNCSTGYDSFYCVDCNEWLDKKCHDATCMFCAERPEKPLPVQINARAAESARSTMAALEAAKNGTYDPNKEY